MGVSTTFCRIALQKIKGAIIPPAHLFQMELRWQIRENIDNNEIYQNCPQTVASYWIKGLNFF